MSTDPDPDPRRAFVAAELLSSERQYTTDLHVLLEYLLSIRAFAASWKPKGFFSSTKVKFEANVGALLKIEGSVQSLLHLHEELLCGLENCSTDDLGDYY